MENLLLDQKKKKKKKKKMMFTWQANGKHLLQTQNFAKRTYKQFFCLQQMLCAGDKERFVSALSVFVCHHLQITIVS